MDGKDTTILRNRFRRALFAAATTGITQALWAAGPRIAFDIPASEFSQAIIQFYKQTNVEILYASPGSLGPVKTRAVAGELEVSEALTRMLEGTGYTFEFESERSVLLKPADGGSVVVETESKLGPVDSKPRTPMLAEIPSANAQPVQDVVVTGTFIHGVLDIMSPLVHVDKAQMKSTGYATVQDALLTLPLNSGAGPSDDVPGSGNFNRGTAPNLRGLGYGATLVLVNGRRQPFAGLDADFVDTSNIPWSAVERIEVLPDGSSALYGSDAIAGVVNIVMREDLEGAETQGRVALPLSGGSETVFAQLFGHRWDGGKWLLSYQFSERQALAAAARSYTADSDKTSLGGSDHRTFWSSPGNILSPYTLEPAFGIPQGQDGSNLQVSDLSPALINWNNSFAAYDLMPERQLHSVFLNASQKMNERFELYAEARYGQRKAEQRQFELNQLLVVPATNPYFVDPFGGMPFVLVAYSFLDDLGPPVFQGVTRSYDGTLGVKMDLGRAWRADLLASFGGEDMRWVEANYPDPKALATALADPDPSTAFNPFGDGSNTNPQTIEAIRSSSRSQVASSIEMMSFVADGTLWEMPTGALKLAVGIEKREEALRHHLAELPAAEFGRHISSAFAEISLPLIGKLHEPRSIPRLELSLAGRYEQYSDFGDTFNPKVGMRWVPLEWAKFRGSWGTSFKAPKLLDLYDTSQNAAALLLIQDPRSESGQSLVLVQQGNNTDLKEETATTWTAGVDIMPEFAPGMTMSLTYYDIDYDDRILRPGPASPFDILLQEAQWAAVITRSPPRDQIAQICNGPNFFGSRVDCANSSPAALIDFRLRNLATTKTKGLDLKLDYSLDTSHGNFEFGLIGTRIFSFEQAFSRTAPTIDIVDTVANPLSMRFRGSAEWNQRGRNLPGFNIGIVMTHAGSYRDVETASEPRRVGDFTTFNFRIGYRSGRAGGGWLDGVETVLNVVNVLDEDPPFVDRSFGYDESNTDPIGRVVSFYMQKSW